MRTRSYPFIVLVCALILGGGTAAAAAPPPTPEALTSDRADGVVLPPPAAERLTGAAAAKVGLPAAGRGQAWFKVVEETRNDTATTPEGQTVTTTGQYAQYLLADDPAGTAARAGTSGEVSATASGCYVGTYWTNPYRTYFGYPHYKYGPQAYAWVELSSGCATSDWFYVSLYEQQPVAKPRVGYASGTAYPGKGRVTIYASYTGLGRCEGYKSHAFGLYSVEVRVCP